MNAGPAESIGELGGRLRPPHVRGPPSSNNIVYNIVFSSEKKKYIYIYIVYNIVFSSDEKKNIVYNIVFSSEEGKKKKTVSHI